MGKRKQHCETDIIKQREENVKQMQELLETRKSIGRYSDMFKPHKYLKFITAVALFFSILLANCALSPIDTEAKTWTKSSVQKEYKKTKKEVSKLENQYAAAQNKAKSQSGTLVTGKIISRNPLILQNSMSLFDNSTYYWITSGGEYVTDMLLYAQARVITTGGYRYYNNIPCVECYAIKNNTTDTTSIKTKLDNKRKKMKKLKNALKNQVVFAKKNYKLEVGDTLDLTEFIGLKYNENYSEIAYQITPKNKYVAENKRTLVIRGKKPGVITLYAQTSVSEKVSKVKIRVVK